jgi:hypothetical protein
MEHEKIDKEFVTGNLKAKLTAHEGEAVSEFK